MHRIDVATATGRPLDVDETHDGRLVADLVADWAITHDEPFTLTLTGPAGGTFISGHGGEHVNVDAVDFARTLAGRLPGHGLLAHGSRSDQTRRHPHDRATRRAARVRIVVDTDA